MRGHCPSFGGVSRNCSFVGNPSQCFKSVSFDIIHDIRKIPSPRHPSRVKKRIPKLPLIFRIKGIARASLFLFVFAFKQRNLLKNFLSDMAGNNTEKVLNCKPLPSPNQKMDMISADGLLVYFDAESLRGLV